jgi:DNA-3-methyladenine glycosylase II
LNPLGGAKIPIDGTD